ncbi:MAG: NifB/NifX family molybdenum-iron cluster-binding protein [Bacillota bacterium]
MEFKVAGATDNEQGLITGHFGEAECYCLYKINEQEIEKIKKIDNTTTTEEEFHASADKAESIKELLKEEGVEVILSRKFGPNLELVKKDFVPVIARRYTLENAVKFLQNNLALIKQQWDKEQHRSPIVLDGQNYHRR